MSKTEIRLSNSARERPIFPISLNSYGQHGLEGEDTEIINEVKEYLYGQSGNVGATEGGLSCLEEEDIIPAVLDIANNSPIPSVRGSVFENCCHSFVFDECSRTCFFVLGLISSTSSKVRRSLMIMSGRQR